MMIAVEKNFRNGRNRFLFWNRTVFFHAANPAQRFPEEYCGRSSHIATVSGLSFVTGPASTSASARPANPHELSA